MTRRDYGSGGVSWHPRAGKWIAQARLPDGRRPSKYFPGDPPPAHPPTLATKWLRQTITRAEEGRLSYAGRVTVGVHVANWFTLRKPALVPSTARTYEALLHHFDSLKAERLDRLRSHRVQRWLNELAAAGLAKKTIGMVRNLLSQACDAAITWGLLATNPVTPTEVPQTKPAQTREAWDPVTAKAFLASVVGDEHEALFTTLIYTGMRQGEVRGLHWSDVDLDARRIHRAVGLDEDGRRLGETKTRRVVQVPIAAPLDRALRDHRRRQAERQLAAKRWSDGGWVFTREDGRPFSGGMVRNRFKAACERAGLTPLTPHAMRHTAATVMADAGIPLGTIAAILGHATISQTQGTYLHVSAAELQRAVDAIAERLSS